MDAWLDEHGRLFNPDPHVTVWPLPTGRPCVIIDNVLANPQGLVAWAATQPFIRPEGDFYPGIVLDLPVDIVRRVADLFDQHARERLGGRRTLGGTVRLCLVTTPEQDLSPAQWLCHRDRMRADNDPVLDIASVLYLFRDPALGGTSFYKPRRSAAETSGLLADCMALDPATFAERHGVRPGYMHGSNAWFDHVASVPAAWNRMTVYDGSAYHSGDIGRPEAINADPLTGRLTMNGFFTCKPVAR